MTGTISSIQRIVARRGVTRLCHFTPSRNLGHIAEDPIGILAAQHLEDDEKAVYNPTDLERLDGFPDHVCCSIQYPNAWYFRDARNKEQLFLDWVVLLIDVRYLWRVGTKFCPRNAAAEHGTLVREGADAFESLFAESVLGAGGRTFTRYPQQPAFLPTDEQAEVLVPDQIQREDVLGIAVRDEGQAKREIARLNLIGRSPPSIVIVPQYYDARVLSGLLRAGQLPVEHEHNTRATNA